jgi:hypothetical protein
VRPEDVEDRPYSRPAARSIAYFIAGWNNGAKKTESGIKKALFNLSGGKSIFTPKASRMALPSGRDRAVAVLRNRQPCPCNYKSNSGRDIEGMRHIAACPAGI